MNILDLIITLIIEEARKGILDVAVDLARLDQRLADLATSIPPSLQTNPGAPGAVPANLHAIISTVRHNYLQEAVAALNWAVRQTPLSLWLQSLEEEEP